MQSKESGGVVLWIVGAVVAAALLVGGIYFVKHRAQPASEQMTTEQTSQTESTDQQISQTDQTDQTSDAADEQQNSSNAQQEEQDATETTEAATETSNQNQTQTLPGTNTESTIADTGATAPAEIAATGPTDVFASIIAIIGLATTTYVALALRKSTVAVERAALRK